MLVLSRKLNQSITLYGSDRPITVSVERLNDGQVRIGIDAPRNVHIVRSELTVTTPPETIKRIAGRHGSPA